MRIYFFATMMASIIAFFGFTDNLQAAVISHPPVQKLSIIDDNEREKPKILSAAWGTHAKSFCPNRPESDFDNMPVTFNWFIKPSSFKATDFIIYNEEGVAIQPVCA